MKVDIPDRFGERLAFAVVGLLAVLLALPIVLIALPASMWHGSLIELVITALLGFLLLMGGQHLVARAIGVPFGVIGRRLGRRKLDATSLAIINLAAFGVMLPLGVLLAANGSWLVFNVAFAFLLGYVLTPLHEAGHALMAVAVGHRVLRVTLGGAFGLPRFRWRGTEFALRLPPSGGMVTTAGPRPGNVSRMRLIGVILGGPMVNILLGSAGWLLREPAFASAFAPAWALLLANGAVLFWNLVPSNVLSPIGEHPNDGRSALIVLRAPRAVLEEGPAYAWASLAIQRTNEHDVAGALEALAETEARLPMHPAVKSLRGFVLLEQENPAAAREEFLACLDGNDTRPEALAVHLNNIAWCDVLIGDPDLRDEADCYSNEALALAPLAMFKGTRGFVLAWLRDLDAGIALLDQALDEAGSPLTACALAIAHKWAGDDGKARRNMKLALKMDPKCALLPRVTALLSEPAAAAPA